MISAFGLSSNLGFYGLITPVQNSLETTTINEYLATKNESSEVKFAGYPEAAGILLNEIVFNTAVSITDDGNYFSGKYTRYDGETPIQSGAYVIGPDCNDNGQPDSYDIASGISQDCDGNGVPDECQPDCDGDGTIDACKCKVDIVLIVDASQSMQTISDNVIANIEDAVVEFAQTPIRVRATLLIPAGSSSFDIPTRPWMNGPPRTVASATGSSESSCTTTARTLGGCTGIGDGGGPTEDWGYATSVVSEHFDWLPDSLRIVATFSDEYAGCGCGVSGCPDTSSPPNAQYADDIAAAQCGSASGTLSDVKRLAFVYQSPCGNDGPCSDLNIMSFLGGILVSDRTSPTDTDPVPHADRVVVSNSVSVYDRIVSLILEFACPQDCDIDGIPDDCDTEDAGKCPVGNACVSAKIVKFAQVVIASILTAMGVSLILRISRHS